MEPWPEAPAPADDAGIAPWETVLHHLDRVNVFHDPTPLGPDPRPGLGPKGFVRAAGRSLLHPYHQLVLARQAQFNASVANLLNAILPRFQVHEAGEAGRVVEILQTELRAAVEPLVRTAVERLRSEIAPSVQALTVAVDRLDRVRLRELEQTLLALRTSLERRADELEARIGRTASEAEARQAAATQKAADLAAAVERLRQGLALHTSRLELLRSESERARREPDARAADERATVAHRRNGAAPLADLLDPLEYIEFENRFRGPRDDVRRRQEDYLPLLVERVGGAPASGERRGSAVLDVGCGRGEFLELLRDAGIPARGIDVNEAMVEECRRRGLDVERAEALAHLRGLPDGSLDAIVCFQVVEHLPVEQLVELLRLCRQKLRQGGLAIWETVNPLNLIVSATTFYLDPTHERQLHPLLLQFLAGVAGFSSAEIRFATPVPEGLRLQGVPADAPAADIHNANVARLNDLLFAPQEYAVVAVA